MRIGRLDRSSVAVSLLHAPVLSWGDLSIKRGDDDDEADGSQLTIQSKSRRAFASSCSFAVKIGRLYIDGE